MATRDLSAFFEDGALDYPGIKSTAHPAGKTYRVASPDAKTGLYLSNLADTGALSATGGEVTDKDMERLQLDDDGERSLYQTVLGPTFEEMLADGVSWTLVQRISRDAFLCFGVNPEFADAILDLQGKAVARENRAARRSSARKATSTGRTQRAKAGSSSAKASTGTRGRTPARTFTPSSRKTPQSDKPRQAKTA